MKKGDFMNIPTILVATILAVIFVLIVTAEVKKRKKGGCGCGCSGCANAGVCHSKKK